MRRVDSVTKKRPRDNTDLDRKTEGQPLDEATKELDSLREEFASHKKRRILDEQDIQDDLVDDLKKCLHRCKRAQARSRHKNIFKFVQMFLELRVQQNLLFAEDCTVDKFIDFVSAEESDLAMLCEALEHSGISLPL